MFGFNIKLIQVFLLFLVLSCDGLFFMQKKVFIFDFDDTIWQRTSWVKELEKHGRIKNSDEVLKTLHEFKVIKNEYSATHETFKKHNIKLTLEDVKIVQNLMKSRVDEQIKQIIKNIQKDGGDIFIIGGGVYGCAFISDVVSDMNIKPENIFSGYFNGFSDVELVKVLNSGYKYYNCKHPNSFTPESHKKSDLVRFLKDTGKISSATKVINIGDGLNDLEIFTAKESDVFIGFGLYKQREEVVKNATYFVKTLEDFKKVLKSLNKS